jgi:hypothetical protein
MMVGSLIFSSPRGRGAFNKLLAWLKAKLSAFCYVDLSTFNQNLIKKISSKIYFIITLFFFNIKIKKEFMKNKVRIINMILFDH